jgi:hypothetical protein
MVSYTYRVVHTDKETSIDTDITEAVAVNTDEGISSRVDSFNFNIYKNGCPVELDCEDGIQIYFNDALVMDGKITDYTLQISASGTMYGVKGQNKLEAILNNVAPAYYTDKTASYIITDLINKVNSWNSSQNGWIDIATGEISATTMQFDYYQPYKPVFQMIEELSTNKYTGNGSYIYYLDAGTNFVWKPRPTEISDTEFLCEGLNDISIKIEKGTWDLVNAAIINAGADLNGAPVFAYAYNAASIGKVGWKWKYLTMVDIAKEFINKNPGANNTEVRNGVRTQARNLGNQIVLKLGTPRFKVNWEMRGSLDYQKGDLYKLVVPSIGWTSDFNQQLRLTDIKHTFNTKGWITDLSFEEDEDAALATLLGG